MSGPTFNSYKKALFTWAPSLFEYQMRAVTFQYVEMSAKINIHKKSCSCFSFFVSKLKDEDNKKQKDF